jgi:hypothetical protein
MKKNIKGIRPEIIAVAAIFLLGCILVVGLSGKNIISALSYNNKSETEPVNPVVSNELSGRPAAEVRPPVAAPVLLTENPVKKVRAIVEDTTLINDDNRFYKVGDIVEGQAEIVAIEPNGIYVEWNSTKSFVPLDYSSTVANETQAPGRSQAVNQPFGANLTQGQMIQMQNSMMVMGQNIQNFMQNLSPQQQTRVMNRMMQMGQTMQNMSAEEQTAIQTRMEQMGQRLANMPEQQRQQAMTQVQQQMQDWMLSDQEGFPEFTLE